MWNSERAITLTTASYPVSLRDTHMDDTQDTQDIQDIPDCEQWDFEPDLWYQRFLYYCSLGPHRSMIGALRLDDQARGITGKTRRSVPGEWWKKADHWEWEDRARAYDAYMRRQGQGRASKLNSVADQVVDRLIQEAEATLNRPDADIVSLGNMLVKLLAR